LERLEQMIDYLIVEPSFADSPVRCYKLPFVVTEALISDSKHIHTLVFTAQQNPAHGTSGYIILDKLFSYIL
jgi:hypothetical protein